MNPGPTRLTADGAVGPSGKPVRIFSVEVLSGATAGELVLRHGTGASGTIWVQQDGTASKTKTFNWEGGLLFPDGCFFDKDTNVTAIVASYVAV